MKRFQVFLLFHLLIIMKFKKWFSLSSSGFRFPPCPPVPTFDCCEIGSMWSLLSSCSYLFSTLLCYEIEKWILIVSLCPLFVLMTPLGSYCCYGFPLPPLCSLCPYCFSLFLFSHSANPLFNRLDMYLSLLSYVKGHINSYSMICLFLHRLQTIST